MCSLSQVRVLELVGTKYSELREVVVCRCGNSELSYS